jgi:hypothetical protein
MLNILQLQQDFVFIIRVLVSVLLVCVSSMTQATTEDILEGEEDNPLHLIACFHDNLQQYGYTFLSNIYVTSFDTKKILNTEIIINKFCSPCHNNPTIRHKLNKSLCRKKWRDGCC